MDNIRKEGFKLTSAMIVCNTEDYSAITPVSKGKMVHGKKVLFIKK